MVTPPSKPPLNVVLRALKADFELTDEQIAALPPLDEVELALQSDSRLIEHSQVAVFTYHPYKLFIGEYKNDPFYAYLQRTGARKQYQIELCSVDTDNDTHYPPMQAAWYGSVNNLAYPFNTFLGTARFVAVVKWYFLVAFRAGEFVEDPRFSVTASWRKDLQGACDELIAEPGREEQRKLKEEEKKLKEEDKRITETRRAEGRERRKSFEAFKQATESPNANAAAAKPNTKADSRPLRTSTCKGPAPTTDRESNNDTQERRPGYSSDRHNSHSRRAPCQYDQTSGAPPIYSQQAGRNSPPRYPSRPRNLRPEDARPPRYHPDRREASPPRRSTNAMFAPMFKTRGEGRREDGETAKKKSCLVRESDVPTAEQSTRRRKNEYATEAKKPKVIDGSVDDKDDENDGTSVLGTTEVKRLTPTEDDEIKEEESERASAEMERALREEEWMQLWRQKVDIARRMREVENEMSVAEQLAVFDKIRHA